MKYRIFILPLLLGPISASAYNLSIYYDKNGNCDEFCNFQYQGPGCCPAQSVVTADAIAEKFMSLAAARDEVFSGFKLDDETEIMDAQGNLLLTGRQINDLNLDSSVTLRTTNTCASDADRNDNGFCVYGLNTATEDYTYVDFTNGEADDGYEVSPSDLGGTPKGNSCMHSKFKVKIHWCPPKYGAYTGNWTGENGLTGWNPPSSPTGFYPELWPEDCEGGGEDLSEVLNYEWTRSSGNTCYDHISESCKGAYDNNGVCRCAFYKKNGVILDQLDVPSGKFTDWTLRGFYLRSEDLSTPPTGCTSGINQSYHSECFKYWGDRNYFAKWLVTTKNNTDGAARLGLLKNSQETGYIPLNDLQLVNWANTRWGIWDCNKTDEEVANTTYHLYAGWARNCAQDDGEECSLVINRTGLHELNDKGDAFYQSTCPDGSSPEGDSGSSYNPTCTEVPKNINYTYDKYQTTKGVSVTTCSNTPASGSCAVGEDGVLTLAHPGELSCGENYRFYKWQTSTGGVYDAGDNIPCSYAELGAYEDVRITGVLCDCNNPDNDVRECGTLCTSDDGISLRSAFTVEEDVQEKP